MVTAVLRRRERSRVLENGDDLLCDKAQGCTNGNDLGVNLSSQDRMVLLSRPGHRQASERAKDLGETALGHGVLLPADWTDLIVTELLYVRVERTGSRA